MHFEISRIKQYVEEAVEFLKSKVNFRPEIGIVLGTGLGKLIDEIHIEDEINYQDIPNFPVSTVESHEGRLIFGKLSGKNIIAMQGRFHYYEGYTMQQITLPIRVMKYLGVEKLIISNACGLLNPNFELGGIMLIDDHINLIGDNPLIGINHEEFGPRFVDMSEPYSKRLLEIAEKTAVDEKIKVHKGVYAAMSGPSLETRAEYRFLRTIGADVIGMSTIPENIVANQMDMEVMGVSIITDECFPDSLEPTDISKIIAVAEKAEPKLAKLISKVVKLI